MSLDYIFGRIENAQGNLYAVRVKDKAERQRDRRIIGASVQPAKQ